MSDTIIPSYGWLCALRAIAIAGMLAGAAACTECETGYACTNVDSFPYIAMLDLDGNNLLIGHEGDTIVINGAMSLDIPNRRLSVSRIEREVQLPDSTGTRSEVVISIPNADLYVNQATTGRTGYLLDYHRGEQQQIDTVYVWVEDRSTDCCTDLSVVELEYLTPKESVPVRNLGQIQEIRLP